MKYFNKKDIFTIPNMICYLRIILIPVFFYIYINANTTEDYFMAASVVIFSSFTDLFDGMIARKFNQVTDLGKILDPVADKLTHAALAICLATRYPMMWLMISLMIIKEGYMAIMGLYFLKRNTMINGAMWFGKICTATLFIGMAILFLLPTIPTKIVNIIITIMIIAMILTLFMYISLYTKLKKDLYHEK